MSTASATQPDIPLFEPLCGRGEPLTVHRELRLFGDAIGLTPRVPSVPSAAALILVLCGASADAQLRFVLGKALFKTFENARRGKNRPSLTSVRALRVQLGKASDTLFLAPGGGAPTDDQLLAQLVGGMSADGLVPELHEMGARLLGTLERCRDSMRACQDPACPRCGAALITESGEWWRRHAPGADGAVQRFVDRVLSLLAFVELWDHRLSRIASNRRRTFSFAAMLDPARTPVGHFLEAYGRLAGCANLGELSLLLVRRGVTHTGGRRISHDLLRKWASRNYMMPPRAAAALAKAAPAGDRMQWQFEVARWLTFVCDLVRAAPADEIPWEGAQEIVRVRYKTLAQNERIRRAKTRKPLPAGMAKAADADKHR
ncbi:hypothetical protein RY831_30215 [Noviherbaspirillum sp. CPCC 100848]|uniref:Uncharacterized protein n=1 Tax=Noviherbaspirillum album TaxID=3080276 RepID=A0ABU6JIE3_9BURK|nr:hypothetical protein [Noviherbaspirillum sp. CPCC 100848]MEC4723421.1 hypothetical protein [Noviherbaspirillum sp. CPCC 100848]